MSTARTHSLAVRMIAMILGIVMCFTSVPDSIMQVFSVGSGFAINLSWTNDSDDTFLSDENSAENQSSVIMRVSYSNKNVSEGYDPHELKITVGGMKDMARTYKDLEPAEAVYREQSGGITADAEDGNDDNNTFDWSYTYSKETNTYTFTNNFAVEERSTFEGSFEIAWRLRPRATITNGEETFKAQMFIPSKQNGQNAESIESNTLTYKETRERDKYTLGIGVKRRELVRDENKTLKGLRVTYDVKFDPQQNARDIYRTSEYFELWFLDGAEVSGRNLERTEETKSDFGDGKTYRKYIVHPRDASYYEDRYWADNTKSWEIDGITVFYPGVGEKESVKAYGKAFGTYFDENDKNYFEEDDDREQLCQAEADAADQEFDYADSPGDLYDASKTSYGYTSDAVDKLLDDMGEEKSSYKEYGIVKLEDLNGGGDKYTYYSDLKLQLKWHGEKGYDSHDLVFVDDSFDLSVNDDKTPLYSLKGSSKGDQSFEFHFTGVDIPSEIKDSYGANIDNDYEVYVKVRHFEKGGNDTKNFVDYNGGSPVDPGTSIRFTDDDIVAVAVEYKGIHGNIGSLEIPASAQTMARCYYEFNVDPKVTAKVDDDSMLTDNMFFVIYNNKDGERVLNDGYRGFSVDDGEYSSKEKYDKDVANYGLGLDRERADVPVASVPSSFGALNVGFDEKESADKNIKHYTGSVGGKFRPGIDVELKEFSLFAYLPEKAELEKKYNTPEDLMSLLTFSSNYEGLTSAEIASHTTITLDTVNGRQVIKFAFDFSDFPLTGESIEVRVGGIPFYVDLKELDSFERLSLNSYVFVDQLGKWFSDSVDKNDIDKDGNTTEQYSSASKAKDFTPVNQSMVSLEKYVKTQTTDGMISQGENDPAADTYIGGTYSYVLKAVVSAASEDSGGSKNIIFADTIEPMSIEPRSQCQGVFAGIDYSAALEKLEYTGGKKPEPTVYYNTTEQAIAEIFDRSIFDKNGWTTVKPANNEDIRAVAVDFGEGLAKPGTVLKVEIKMTAPDNRQNLGKEAKNSGHISYDKLTQSGGVSAHQGLPSNTVRVKYAEGKGRIMLYKRDAVDKKLLPGAEFDLYSVSQPDKPVNEEPLVVGENGILVVGDLEYGDYYLVETKAPDGYKLDSRKHQVTVGADEDTVVITVENERLPGEFRFRKTSDLNSGLDLTGAQFALYYADGTPVPEEKNVTITEDGKGNWTVSGLEWGSYYLVETSAPEGFKKSDEKLEFTIGPDSDGAEIEGDHIVLSGGDFVNKQMPVKVKLIKYEASGDNLYDADGYNKPLSADGVMNKDVPLQGAWYGLYRRDKDEVTGEETITPLGESETNEKGEFTVSDLAIGCEYYFKEVRPPKGYNLNSEEIEFTVDAGFTEKVVEYYAVDSRIPGSVHLAKTDDSNDDPILANPVSGAVYRVYEVDEKDPLSIPDDAAAVTFSSDGAEGRYKYAESGDVTNLKTSPEGTIDISGLPWNENGKTYVLREEKAPKGYEIDSTLHAFKVNSGSTEMFTFGAVDNRKLGSIRIEKVSKVDPKKPVSGAVFEIRRSDGSLYKDNITTEDDGTATVEDIPWGSYYLQEVKAPENYGLSPRKYKFSVNSTTAEKIQVFRIEDPATSLQFKVTKRIKEDDIVWEHGDPTFIFKAESDSHTYIKALSFSKDNKYEKDDKGYISESVLFVAEAGTYTVSEISVNRYECVSIEAKAPNEDPIDSTVTVNSPKDVNFELKGSTNNYEFIFTNNKNDQSGTSDNCLVINTFNASKSPIMITAEYVYDDTENPDEIPVIDDGVTQLENKKVRVTVYYDDGSTKVLNPVTDTYEIAPLNDTMPNQEQTLAVTYTEDGIDMEDSITVRSGNFNVFTYVASDGGDLENGEYITITGYIGTSSVVNFPDVIVDTVNSRTYIVKKIGDGANPVKVEHSVTKITFREGVEIIDDHAFDDSNWALQGDLTIPASVRTIGDNAFMGKGQLTGLSFAPDSKLESIGNYAFQNLFGLSGELNIPPSVESIGNGAFSVAGSQNNVTLLSFGENSNLQTIGERAFEGWKNLTGTLVIPAGVTTIGKAAFDCGVYTSTRNTVKLEFESDRPRANALTIGDVAFRSFPIAGKLEIPANLVFPDDADVTAGVFEQTSFSELSFEKGCKLTEIPKQAFLNCTNLTGELRIPGTVTHIGDSAFKDHNLTGLVFEEGTEDLIIGDSAFAIGNATGNQPQGDPSIVGKLEIPARVTEIEYGAFFNSIKEAELIFKEDLSGGSRLTSIGGRAFECCGFTGNIVFPRSVTKFGSATTKAGVLQVKDSSFPAPDIVILPKSVKEIDYNTFNNKYAIGGEAGGFKNTIFYYNEGTLSGNVLNPTDSKCILTWKPYTNYGDLREKLGDSAPTEIADWTDP